jgi:hypothetical protein
MAILVKKKKAKRGSKPKGKEKGERKAVRKIRVASEEEPRVESKVIKRKGRRDEKGRLIKIAKKLEEASKFEDEAIRLLKDIIESGNYWDVQKFAEAYTNFKKAADLLSKIPKGNEAAQRRRVLYLNNVGGIMFDLATHGLYKWKDVHAHFEDLFRLACSLPNARDFAEEALDQGKLAAILAILESAEKHERKGQFELASSDCDEALTFLKELSKDEKFEDTIELIENNIRQKKISYNINYLQRLRLVIKKHEEEFSTKERRAVMEELMSKWGDTWKACRYNLEQLHKSPFLEDEKIRSFEDVMAREIERDITVDKAEVLTGLYMAYDFQHGKFFHNSIHWLYEIAIGMSNDLHRKTHIEKYTADMRLIKEEMDFVEESIKKFDEDSFYEKMEKVEAVDFPFLETGKPMTRDALFELMDEDIADLDKMEEGLTGDVLPKLDQKVTDREKFFKEIEDEAKDMGEMLEKELKRRKKAETKEEPTDDELKQRKKARLKKLRI